MRIFPLCALLLACADEPRPAQEVLIARDASTDTPRTCELDNFYTCPGGYVALDVRGQSPLGEVRIERSSVNYVHGFMLGTVLAFDGTIGPHSLRLTVAVGESGVFDHHVVPGSYTGDILSARYDACGEAGDLQGVRLDVVAHDYGKELVAGSAVDYRGTATVTEPGWSLELPFALTQACTTSIDL